ncbi:UNVERIFIED_CONTAM: hypothetical protein GTU68_064116 [Idotea baltica]|nr:hypothetical protein [Idotea baltica]
MKHFTSIDDVKNLTLLLSEALKVSDAPFAHNSLGTNKTLGLIFFNPSLRTRLSSQRAAQNLGLSVIVMNIGSEGWKLEFADRTVMDGNKAEHIKDAAAVMGQYCEIIGIRAFAGLDNREEDYQEKVLEAFKTYSGVPIISLESATRHPLQAFADSITIAKYKTIKRPKVVLTWAPHPRALPQAVGNSFAAWMLQSDVDLVVTHPEGYELNEEITAGATIEYDQRKAFEGAHFVYAKNWSSYREYGQILRKDLDWTVTANKMALTNQGKFMHCLPVRRNVVVADAVIDSPNSLVQTQAANRVVAAQTILKQMLLNS